MHFFIVSVGWKVCTGCELTGGRFTGSQGMIVYKSWQKKVYGHCGARTGAKSSRQLLRQTTWATLAASGVIEKNMFNIEWRQLFLDFD